MTWRELVSLFTYREGVIPDGEQRRIGFRWKVPPKGHFEAWRVGCFIDIGRDDQIGIEWSTVRIDNERR